MNPLLQLLMSLQGPAMAQDKTIEVNVDQSQQRQQPQQQSQKVFDFYKSVYNMPKISEVPIMDLSKSEKSLGTKFGKLEGDGLAKGLILHHTGGRGKVGSIMDIFKQRGFPAQYVLDRDGTIYRTLPEGYQGRQIKSGKGIGQGFTNANTEGIEVIAKNSEDFTPKQQEALKKFIAWHSQKNLYDPTQTVFGHGEINPHKDPGEGLIIARQTRLKPLTSKK